MDFLTANCILAKKKKNQRVVSCFRYGKKLPYVVTCDICLFARPFVRPSVRPAVCPSSVGITFERGSDRSTKPIILKPA